MNMLTVLFIVVVTQQSLPSVVGHNDPSACHRVIKFMLINACGASKREFSSLPKYQAMSEEEIEKRYHALVKAKMIKGIETNSVETGKWDWDAKDADIKHADFNDMDVKDAYYNDIYRHPYYNRLRRSVMGIGLRGPMMKTLLDAAEHERRGSFTFIGRLQHESDDGEDRSPAPGELKAKCCGSVVLCSIDDFRSFCE